ncbi:MAG: DUF4139 domain-containing protein [bacterium]
MKPKRYFLALLLAAVPALLLAEERDTVTVYADRFALAREVRTLTLSRGEQEHKLADIPAQIDPASVTFRAAGPAASIRLLEQRFEFDLADADRVLEKSVGRPIIVGDKQGQAFPGTLLRLAAGDLLLQTEDGALRLVKADNVATVRFPALPEDLITRPTLTWLLDSGKAGSHRIEISYLTGGLGWQTEYAALASRDEDRLKLSAWATVENASGKSFADVQVNLVAGEVHRAQPVPLRVQPEDSLRAKAEAAPFPDEEPFSEYHLYRLGRAATLPDRQARQLSLFAPVEFDIEKTYRYEGQRSKRTVLAGIRFRNDRQHGPGLPLPAGRLRIYREDDQGSQIFIGEDRIENTAMDEQVQVKLGAAFDLTGERTVKERTQVARGSRQETIEIRIRSRKARPVTVLVAEHHWGDWQLIGKPPPVKKKDAQTVEFELAVPPGGEAVLDYLVLIGD